jgi:uncharacterized protein
MIPTKLNSLPTQKILTDSWVDARLEIHSSPLHRKGVFTKSAIKKDEIVIIWGGTLFTWQDIQEGKVLEHSFTAFGDGIWLGHTPVQGTSADDFVNHSCDPNIWFCGGYRLAARRPIAAGEELTIDYVTYWGPEEEMEVSWECQCGSALCRKRFSTLDWRKPELQLRYRGHFTPYLREQIRRHFETTAEQVRGEEVRAEQVRGDQSRLRNLLGKTQQTPPFFPVKGGMKP